MTKKKKVALFLLVFGNTRVFLSKAIFFGKKAGGKRDPKTVKTRNKKEKGYKVHFEHCDASFCFRRKSGSNGREKREKAALFFLSFFGKKKRKKKTPSQRFCARFHELSRSRAEAFDRCTLTRGKERRGKDRRGRRPLLLF